MHDQRACSELSDVVRLSDHTAHFAGMATLGHGNWSSLLECRSCGQRWSVDEWDKYHTQLAIKIPRGAAWKNFDTLPLRKQYMVEARGGVTNERCAWLNCNKLQVKGTAYCVDHLYATGARE